jgi:ketosteroid isomerase-like protein
LLLLPRLPEASDDSEEASTMGEAREVMDRLTEAVFAKDREAATALYASDAVAVTPDQGEVTGAGAIMKWNQQFFDAFPDARYESLHAHESGNTAIDEGYFVGTHTGPLASPTGDVPPTGRSVRLRACDIVTVEDGLVTSHRFYFDRVEFQGQLGLMEGPG